MLLNRLGRRMATFVSGAALLAWATPAVSASVIFVWLADPDGGVVDWTLSRLPHWLGGGAHWASFSWTNSALPAYTLITVLLLWQGFPFIAVTVLAGLKTVPAECAGPPTLTAPGHGGVLAGHLPAAQADLPGAAAALVIWDFGVFTQVYIVIGELGNRDEYNLGIYAYDRRSRIRPATARRPRSRSSSRWSCSSSPSATSGHPSTGAIN